MRAAVSAVVIALVGHVGGAASECGTTRSDLKIHVGQLKNQLQQDLRQLQRMNQQFQARGAAADRWIELADESDAQLLEGLRDAFKNATDAVLDELEDKAVSATLLANASGSTRDPRSWQRAYQEITETERLEMAARPALGNPDITRAINMLKNARVTGDEKKLSEGLGVLFKALKSSVDAGKIGYGLGSAGAGLDGPQLDSLAHTLLDLTSTAAGLMNPMYGTAVKLLFADAEYATFMGFNNLIYRYSGAELDRLSQQNQDDLIARQLVSQALWKHLLQLHYANRDLAACGTGNTCDQVWDLAPGRSNYALSGLQCHDELSVPLTANRPPKTKPAHHIGPGTALAIVLVGAGVPLAVAGAALAAQQANTESKAKSCSAGFPAPSIVCNSVYESFNGTAQCAASQAAAQAYCQCEGYSTYVTNASSFGINPPSVTCR